MVALNETTMTVLTDILAFSHPGNTFDIIIRDKVLIETSKGHFSFTAIDIIQTLSDDKIVSSSSNRRVFQSTYTYVSREKIFVPLRGGGKIDIAKGIENKRKREKREECPG